MAIYVGGIKLDTAVLDRMTAEARPHASKIVNKYGLAITTEAATKHPWKLRTGALTNSLLSESHMENDMLFILQDGVEYGLFLELGTSKMAAYPFVVPAIESWRNRFLDAFKELFK